MWKPWFSATFGPVTLCGPFLWEKGLCAASCCALSCRPTRHWLLFMSPALGTTAPGSAPRYKMSSQRWFRLHKTEFKIVAFSQHLEHVFVNINFQHGTRCQQSWLNRCRTLLLRIVSAVISPHEFSPWAFAICLSRLQIICLFRLFCRKESVSFLLSEAVRSSSEATLSFSEATLNFSRWIRILYGRIWVQTQ